LYGQLATPGTDFIATSDANLTLVNGASDGWVPVYVLPSNVPKLSEKFLVQLTRVELASTNVVGNPNYLPSLGGVTMTTVYIAANQYPHGLFAIYSNGPLVVNTKQQSSVQLYVQRMGEFNSQRSTIVIIYQFY